MQTAKAARKGEERLQRLGIYFQAAFADHQQLIENATAAITQCESRLACFKVPIGSGRWSRLRDHACSDEFVAVLDSTARLRRTSRLIRSIPATTVAGLTIKARCLPFDTGGSNQVEGSNGSKVDVEALCGLIDEIERLAYIPNAAPPS